VSEPGNRDTWQSSILGALLLGAPGVVGWFLVITLSSGVLSWAFAAFAIPACGVLSILCAVLAGVRVVRRRVARVDPHWGATLLVLLVNLSFGGLAVQALSMLFPAW
jgi:hypothetical protein